MICCHFEVQCQHQLRLVVKQHEFLLAPLLLQLPRALGTLLVGARSLWQRCDRLRPGQTLLWLPETAQRLEQ